MIARILVINESDLDLSSIVGYFQESYCPVQISRTLEEALRFIGHEHIDLTILTIDNRSCKYFADFFSILRVVVGLVPLVAVTKDIENNDFSEWTYSGVDDIIQADISKDELFRRLEVLVKAKSELYQYLVKRDSIGDQQNKNIVYFSTDPRPIFDQSFIKSAKIQYADNLQNLDDYSSSDLILIDSSLQNAAEICATIKLGKTTKHTPIVLTYDENNNKAIELLRANIGVSAIVDTFDNKSVTSCRINSYIKYKRLLDDFFSKVKKNIYLSSIDILTEVYNRSFFEEYISHRTYALANSAILMIDVDKFKQINDKFGHAFADEVLRKIAKCIKDHTRPTDIIARYGGDEFIIFMHNITKFEIQSIALRLKDSVASTEFNGVHCSLSIGCCCSGTDTLSIREAINIADKSMYLAKQSGGNSVRILAQ